MAQPIWITPAGSLGTIPDGIFYQNNMLASTPVMSTTICTATDAATNRITCESTEFIYPGTNVMFSGDVFGGVLEPVRYFVLDVVNSTQFRIAATEFDTEPIELTNGTGSMLAEFRQHVYFKLIAGKLPDGIQCSDNGLIIGTPNAVASLQGIPLEVGADTTSKFTVRAYTLPYPIATANIADRTFSLTIAIAPGPAFTTPAGSIGQYYDSDYVNFQFDFVESFTPDTTYVELVSGQLPGGLTLTPEGLLTGYIQPTPDVNATPGYAITSSAVEPYDFLSRSQSKNFQFSLKVTNGKNSDLQTFQMYVYSRDQMGADDSVLIDNNTFITTDETRERAPFIVNSNPSNLGIFRSNNYFAYQFIGEDYDTTSITYAISVNQGAGFAPGLSLDPVSGWYYGYIPDQGTTEVEYSFNVTVYQDEFVNQTITCISAAAGTNEITCNGTGFLTIGQPIVFNATYAGLTAGTTYYVDTIVSEDIDPDSPTYNTTVFTLVGATLTSTSNSVVGTLIVECTETNSTNNQVTCFSTASLGVGQPLIFTGTSFGDISTDSQTIYYVREIFSETEFTLALTPGGAEVALTTDTGYLTANFIVASQPYPFTITLTGAVDAEVTWITDANLGTLVNGETSLLKIEAVNRGGRTLAYRLKSGAYNQLPQGLKLLPSGDIVGRVSFDTFALDLGATTFDKTLGVTRNVAELGTTFDSTFTFTVNAYAPEATQLIYEVESVTVTDGGTGYSSITPPTLEFNTPVGASAVTALAGNVTVSGGAVTAVEVAEAGNGYTSPATITITQGFGGSGAEFEAVMKVSGSRDVVSVYKTFTVKVYREYNKPYQNLYIRAMPPPSARVLVRSLLDNKEIFPDEYIYRSDDPNFGKSKQVTYAHAFGLAPDTLDRYVASLYENHYWKNLVLGQVQTAQALDANGNVVYEVVYSKIVDDLVNAAGESVSKIVALPYPIIDPNDGSTILNSVYPNSLVDMRDQVIDVVGQISTTLPLWMTSKQTNGRVLGFTPAWVIAYTKPGYSAQIAYYMQQQFGDQLNKVDFKVDRYILDRSLSRNWDTETQHWTPKANLTTFDRTSTSGYNFVGTVSIATNLAYADVNDRTLGYINDLGGLDGKIGAIDGNTIVFVKQQDYDGPPGSSYPTIGEAWQTFEDPFDSNGFDDASFDQSGPDVPNGTPILCTDTIAATSTIVCEDTSGMIEGQPIQFTEGVIGGLVLDQLYYILSIDSLTDFTVTDTEGGLTPVALTDDSGIMTGKPADERMAIYTINVDPISGLISLTLTKQTYVSDFVQIERGNYYRSAQLYYPGAPGEGLTEINWQPLITIVTDETIFDEGSMAFVEPVDMYNPTDTIDKYLVFPKSNILV